MKKIYTDCRYDHVFKYITIYMIKCLDLFFLL